MPPLKRAVRCLRWCRCCCIIWMAPGALLPAHRDESGQPFQQVLQGCLRLLAAQTALQFSVKLADASALEFQQFLPDFYAQHARRRFDDFQRQTRLGVEQAVDVWRVKTIETGRVVAILAHEVGQIRGRLPKLAQRVVQMAAASKSLAAALVSRERTRRWASPSRPVGDLRMTGQVASTRCQGASPRPSSNPLERGLMGVGAAPAAVLAGLASWKAALWSGLDGTGLCAVGVPAGKGVEEVGGVNMTGVLSFVCMKCVLQPAEAATPER